MNIELDELGTDVEVRWNKAEQLYLTTTVARWEDNDGKPMISADFYLSMPLSTAKLLQDKLNEILGV